MSRQLTMKSSNYVKAQIAKNSSTFCSIYMITALTSSRLEATPSEELLRDCDYGNVAAPLIEYLPNEQGGLREVMNTDQKLMHIITLSRHMLELLKVTGKIIPLFYRTENYGRPYQSRDHPPSLAKIRSSSSKTALLALFSGFLMSGSFAWLDKNMELYEASAILNKVIQDLLTRPYTDISRL